MFDGKGYAKFIAAVAGAWIGWSLGKTIASGLTAPTDSFWARAELAGNLLQWGGAAVIAILAYTLAKKVVGD